MVTNKDTETDYIYINQAFHITQIIFRKHYQAQAANQFPITTKIRSLLQFYASGTKIYQYPLTQKNSTPRTFRTSLLLYKGLLDKIFGNKEDLKLQCEAVKLCPCTLPYHKCLRKIIPFYIYILLFSLDNNSIQKQYQHREQAREKTDHSKIWTKIYIKNM